MTLPPSLSTEARNAALAKAAEARTLRAELKAQLKTGAVTFAEVLRRSETDEIVGNTKVLAILESLPGLGKVKARRTMDEVGIADTRRVRGLGGNQRAKLLELVA